MSRAFHPTRPVLVAAATRHILAEREGATVVVLPRSRNVIAQILASGGLGLVFLIDGPFSSCCPHPLPIIEESGRGDKEEEEGLRARTGA